MREAGHFAAIRVSGLPLWRTVSPERARTGAPAGWGRAQFFHLFQVYAFGKLILLCFRHFFQVFSRGERGNELNRLGGELHHFWSIYVECLDIDKFSTDSHFASLLVQFAVGAGAGLLFAP